MIRRSVTRTLGKRNGYRIEKRYGIDGYDEITSTYIAKDKDMKNAEKITVDLDELKKVLGPEQLINVLPKEPKYKLKGRGHQRTKFNVTQQGLQTSVAKAFYEWLPEQHKCTFMDNNTTYKGISPEATSIWVLMEKHKLDLTIDYKTMYDFSDL